MKLSHLIEVLNQYKKSFDEKNYDPDVVVRTDDFEERELINDFCVSASSERDGMYLCLFTYDENAWKSNENTETEVEPCEKEPSKTIEKERMTQKEFNEKYKDFIEEGYSGMELVNETLIWYIDKVMEALIKIPDFKLRTITLSMYQSKPPLSRIRGNTPVGSSLRRTSLTYATHHSVTP